MTMVEMIVNMDCEGCERKVRKSLQNIHGVESIDINMELQKVTVIGSVNQEKVLKKVRRAGKKAELWPFPHKPETIVFTQAYGNMYSYHSEPSTYFHVQQPDHVSMYNHQDLPYSSNGVGERVSIAFNDDNVNACLIM